MQVFAKTVTYVSCICVRAWVHVCVCVHVCECPSLNVLRRYAISMTARIWTQGIEYSYVRS